MAGAVGPLLGCKNVRTPLYRYPWTGSCLLPAMLFYVLLKTTIRSRIRKLLGLYYDYVGTIRPDVGTECSPNLGLFQCSHCTQSIVTAAMLQTARLKQPSKIINVTSFGNIRLIQNVWKTVPIKHIVVISLFIRHDVVRKHQGHLAPFLFQRFKIL